MLSKLLVGSVSFFLVSNIGVAFSVFVVYINAKVLTPEDFGVVGFATILITFLDSFKQIGTKEYLIAYGITDNEKVMNAWSIDLVKSLLLFVLSLILAPLIAAIYKHEALNWVIPLLGVGFLLDGLSNPKFYLLRMELKYKQLVVYSFLVSFSYAMAAVGFVSYFGSYVGVIVGYFARNLAQFAFSYLFDPVFPRIIFVIEECVKQLNYGKWLLLCGVLFFFTSRFDVFALSVMVDVESLGYYTFAISIVTGIVALPLKSINNAVFPILSKNKKNLQFSVVISLAIIASLFMAVLTCLTVPYLLSTFFGGKWEPSIPVLQILSVGVAINSIRIDGYFLIEGRTEYKYKVELARALCFLASIFPFVKYFGIEGAACSFVISSLVGLCVWVRYILKVRASSNPPC